MGENVTVPWLAAWGEEVSRTPTKRPPDSADQATLIVLQEWRDANERVEHKLTELATAVTKLTNEVAGFVAAMNTVGKFLRRYGPWIIALGGPAIASSPTVLKALVTLSGHSVPQ